MGKVKMQLGALQQLMVVHGDALQNGKVRAFKKDGTTVAVDPSKKAAAVRALQAAEVALSDVCQQGVLAIEVEP